MSVPKIIHQIWIQGEQNLPEHLAKNKDKIKELHPTWKYILWDEISILQLLKKTNMEWYKNYYKFEYLHQKVDYAKLIILYLHGGICIDMDAYTIKKLDGLFFKFKDYDFILSYASEFNSIINYILCNNTNRCMNNGIFFGKPNTDILSYMIKYISYECSKLQHKIYCISNTTGPIYFNKYINEYMKDNKNKSKIFILDNDYVEPCVMDICKETENTYIKHKHNMTWIDDYLRKIIELYLLHNRIFDTVFLLILLSLFLVLFYFILLIF